MRHIRFLAVHAHFSDELQKQVLSGTRTFNISNGRTIITVTPTSGTICSMPVWELKAECPESDVQLLIGEILPSMAASCSSLSPSCRVTSSLIANSHKLGDGTYLHTHGSWTRYDEADSLLATLEVVTEVFEVPRDDPRRQHSNISNTLLSSVSAGSSSSSSPAANGSTSAAEPTSSNKVSSRSNGSSRGSVVAGDQQQQQQHEEIFRGLRARCSIPANVPVTTYDGLIITSLDSVNHTAAAAAAAAAGSSGKEGSAAVQPLEAAAAAATTSVADKAPVAEQQPGPNAAAAADDDPVGYFQRYLLGPEQYFKNTSVFNYGNPMTKGSMINDAAGTGKEMNCGFGCLLRKAGRAVSLQDVVLTVRPIAANEELLTSYKLQRRA